MTFLRLIRAKHYIKNTLVFMALLCGGELFNASKLQSSIVGFTVFCLISSASYMVNDIRDLENDRRHPVKSGRPVASGAVSVKGAAFTAICMFTAGITINVFMLRPETVVYPVIYTAVNAAYSLGLKEQPIADVAILAAGFAVRLFYGGSITGIRISNWLFLTVLVFALYFALGKRRNEIGMSERGETRSVLKYYTAEFLDKTMYMNLALGNAFYALWSIDYNTTKHHNGRYMVYTMPVVLIITMRYSLVIEKDSDGDPVEVLFHDRTLMILSLIYTALMIIILYA